MSSQLPPQNSAYRSALTKGVGGAPQVPSPKAPLAAQHLPIAPSEMVAWQSLISDVCWHWGDMEHALTIDQQQEHSFLTALHALQYQGTGSQSKIDTE